MIISATVRKDKINCLLVSLEKLSIARGRRIVMQSLLFFCKGGAAFLSKAVIGALQ